MNCIRCGIFLIIGAILGIQLKNFINFEVALVILALGILSMAGIGMIAGSTFFLLNIKDEDFINWCLDRIVFIFAGFYFPVDMLPEYIRWVTAYIPQSYIYDSLRRILILGEGWSQTIVQAATNLLIFTMVLFPSGLFLFIRGIEVAEKKGELTRWS